MASSQSPFALCFVGLRQVTKCLLDLTSSERPAKLFRRLVVLALMLVL